MGRIYFDNICVVSVWGAEALKVSYEFILVPQLLGKKIQNILRNAENSGIVAMKG